MSVRFIFFTRQNMDVGERSSENFRWKS